MEDKAAELIKGGGDDAKAATSGSDGGSVKSRRLLMASQEAYRKFKGPIVQDDAAKAATTAAAKDKPKLNSDAFGNTYTTATTEQSTGSFEWIYTVLKGGQSVVALAELGVDGE